MAEPSPIMKIFKTLSPEDQKTLNLAFEEKQFAVIHYDPQDKSKFIGLNIDSFNYKKEFEKGPWSIGVTR